MNMLLPRSPLLTVYKSFVRPHLEYGDVIYDQPDNSRLSDKIKTVQCNAADLEHYFLRCQNNLPIRSSFLFYFITFILITFNLLLLFYIPSCYYVNCSKFW